MAEKAVVLQVTGCSWDGSLYHMAVDAVVTTTTDGYIHIQAEATSTNFNPTLPNWKTKISNAVKDAAATHDPSYTVDTVLFPDFGLLSV